MEIIRAGKAGFCMGVALALRQLDEAVLAQGRGRVTTLGPIIHNPQVLKAYEEQGVLRINRPREAKAGMTVLIRAHGVPQEDEALLRRMDVNVVDATCPRVKRAQLAIAEATARGETLLLYGEADHPEVRGLLSYAAGPCRVFGKIAELETLMREAQPGVLYVLAAQTTQDRSLFDALRKELYATMEKRLVVLDTICDATRQRQEETIRLAQEVDVMIVVGGRQSGNTRRLADIAQGCGVPTVLVETEAEVETGFFYGASRIGITAGASTPRSTIDAVEARLRHIKPSGTDNCNH